MRVYVATESAAIKDSILGAFEQTRSNNIDVIALNKVSDFPDNLGSESVVLVDWEMNLDLGVSFVKKAKEIQKNIPVLLLCPNSKTATTFAGMKVGAGGVINSPINVADMFRSIGKAIKRNPPMKQAPNVKFINPFIDATKQVFRTMCSINIKRKQVFLKNDHITFGDISGSIKLSGSTTGSVVLNLPQKLACLVVGRMLGEEPATRLNADACDAIGELITMIADQVREDLVKTEPHFAISTPSVVSGLEQRPAHKIGTQNIVILFEAEKLEFFLQICQTP